MRNNTNTAPNTIRKTSPTKASSPELSATIVQHP
jgi:hypothetical protein